MVIATDFVAYGTDMSFINKNRAGGKNCEDVHVLCEHCFRLIIRLDSGTFGNV